MKTGIRGFFQLALLTTALAVGLAMAQEEPEKHVAEIRAAFEENRDAELGVLCQDVKPDGRIHGHNRKLHPGSLVSDLSTLFENSDDVVIGGMDSMTRSTVMVPSPNGQDGVTYLDAKVLHSWKGSHKVGDLITLALPRSVIRCPNGSTVGTSTGDDENTWSNTDFLVGPFVLFLRHPAGDDAALMMGLTLTGGDGMQGVFSLQQNPQSRNCMCASVVDPKALACKSGVDYISRCNQELEALTKPVVMQLIQGPLGKKYDGMPVAEFLREVQSLAGGVESSTSAQEFPAKSDRQ